MCMYVFVGYVCMPVRSEVKKCMQICMYGGYFYVCMYVCMYGGRLNEAIRSGGASGVANKTSIVRKRRWTRNVRCISAEILQQIRSNITYIQIYVHIHKCIHTIYT